MKSCAICQRPENEVKQLVELTKDGPCICNRCTTTAYNLVASPPKLGKEEEKPLPKPKEINRHLNDYVVGQDIAKRDISVAVYNHYKRREAIKRGKTFEVEIQKSNILIMGPTGSGKTEIARTMAKMLGVPFFVGDATKLTQAGYVGDDVESLLQGLLTACGNDPEKAQWGIILDEIDKVARKSGKDASGYRDVSGEGVQQALLKMLEGSEVTVPRASKSGLGNEYDILDTNNILFICAGSFAGIEDSVRRRKNKGSHLGFGSTERTKHTDSEIYTSLEEDDILDFGLIPELLGRIPVRTTTIPLTEEEMVRILTEPKDAIVRQFQALYEMDGIDLQFDEEALKAIGREAIKRPTGARALRGIVEKVLSPYSYESPSDTTIKGIRITQEVIEGTERPILRESPQVEPQALMAMV